MKRAVQIIVFLCVISVVNAYGNTDRWLSMEANTVDTENNKWYFTSISQSESSPFYRLYGDSLIAEIWDNVRQWYAIRGDSNLYLGEESGFHKAFSKNLLPTSAFGNIWLAGEELSVEKGHYYHTLELGQEGSYKCSLPVRGVMILEDNCIIPAVAITETREFKSHIGRDSLSAESSVSKDITRTRWFVEGDILPVAMQTTKKESIRGKEISSKTYTYLLDNTELPINEETVRGMQIQQALDNADITYENNVIRINGFFPSDTRLKLYISNFQGSLFHLEPIEVMAEGKNTEIRLPSLSSGQYIVTISADTPTGRKIIVNI